MSNIPAYQIVEKVGQGSFGSVYKAFDLTQKKYVALKRITKNTEKLSRQFQILFSLKGTQQIIQIKDFFYTRAPEGSITQNIVFEFIESDLKKYIQTAKKSSPPGIPEETVKSIMYQILKGLSYAHQQNIVHRDLKPGNILIDRFDQIKICDFGCAKVIPKKSQKNVTHIATQNYRAPQLILCISEYNSPVDIWAAGCILAELFLMTHLFDGIDDGDQLIEMFKTIGSFTPREEKILEKRVPIKRNVYKKLTEIEFDKVGLEEIFCMVVDYDDFENLLLRMLRYLPEERITAEEALKHPFFNSVRSTDQNYE